MTSSLESDHCHPIRRGVCSFIPPDILHHIANSNHASEHSRMIAEKSLSHANAVHQARISSLSPDSDPSAHQGQPGPRSIISPDVYQGILDSDDTSPQAKASAARGLEGARAPKKDDQIPIGRPPTKHLQREIYDAHGIHDLPGTKLFAEGHEDESNDHDATQVYKHFGSTYNFYNDKFGRSGVDDHGGKLVGCVHYDDDDGETAGYFNAFYDEYQRRMAFGDGDGEIFTSFTEMVDVIAHELTHGVTSYTSKLMYMHQAGALNESMSDVFGSMVKQCVLNQTADQADWLIGEGIFLVDNAPALRSMKAPGTAYNNPKIGQDTQPADMDGYKELDYDKKHDYGGVHRYSGIPNRAFYITATTLGGYSWEKAGQIWWDTVNDPEIRNVDPKAAFKTFADLTCKHAKLQRGPNGDEGEKALAAVRKAWTDVKVYKSSAA